MEEEIADAEAKDREHDETNEMYNMSGDEDAAKEMAMFLESIEKNDLTDAIKQTLKAKIENATVKLTGLFERQRTLSLEEEAGHLEKDANNRLASDTANAAAAEDKNVQKQNANNVKNIMAQKKVNTLEEQLEMAEMKARTVTVQW